MIVKVSKRFCDIMQKELKKDENFKNYNLFIKSFKTGDALAWFTGYEPIDTEQDKSGAYIVLGVEYPQEFYANNLYLNTKELQKIARQTIPLTFENFVENFKNKIEC